jgi:cation diffusion facilitator family transporter
MSGDDSRMTEALSADHRRLRLALAANIGMFVVGIVGWRVADSASLLADAFDMLADALGYLVAFLAVNRSTAFKTNAARLNGAMLVLLGAGVLVEVVDHYLTGSKPVGLLIFAFASLSLLVNGAVLRMLSRYRNSQEPYLKATWTDTRADVIVNVSVLVSGLLIALTGIPQIDLAVGFLIGCYVIHEGYEIWQDAKGDPDEQPDA